MAVIRVLFFLAIFVLSGSALAEGRCPPGHYPIGGQGAGGCAPIPAAGTVDDSPKPLGRWHKTWGAFAFSEDASELGIALKRPSKRAALRDAEGLCAANGGVGCKGGFSFKNQCAAIVSGMSAEKGFIQYGGAATEARARVLAVDTCERKGGRCEIMYSGCTEQIFERF